MFKAHLRLTEKPTGTLDSTPSLWRGLVFLQGKYCISALLNSNSLWTLISFFWTLIFKMVVTPIRGTVNKRMGNSTENVYSSGYFNYFLYVLFLFYLLFILKDWMVAVGYFFFLKATKHLLFSFCTAVSIMPGTYWAVSNTHGMNACPSCGDIYNCPSQSQKAWCSREKGRAFDPFLESVFCLGFLK